MTSMPACVIAFALFAVGAGVQAQPVDDARTPASATGAGSIDWQACQRLAGDDGARLACFDRWALQRQEQHQMPVAAADAVTPAASTTLAAAPAESGVENCHDRRYSTLSRFWELERGSDCGTFGFRGYRPVDVSFSVATKKPEVPTSPSAGHTGSAIDYQAHEMRIGLSVRTKLAQGLLTSKEADRRDSLWFGYTQQSTWQLFNGDISRPFRTTDHEPEMMYVYPVDLSLPGGWHWRYAGLGLVHQSNGQSLPYSRSWNRVYLMGGAELDDRFIFTGRIWQRLNESANSDDNPDISDYVGRAELSARWNIDRVNQIGVTLRNNLRDSGRGSIRLEWSKVVGDAVKSNLRLHTRLFHGYGDTLVDYNRKRTVFSVGLSLIDF